jgi:hypothetical protein
MSRKRSSGAAVNSLRLLQGAEYGAKCFGLEFVTYRELNGSSYEECGEFNI